MIIEPLVQQKHQEATYEKRSYCNKVKQSRNQGYAYKEDKGKLSTLLLEKSKKKKKEIQIVPECKQMRALQHPLSCCYLAKIGGHVW